MGRGGVQIIYRFNLMTRRLIQILGPIQNVSKCHKTKFLPDGRIIIVSSLTCTEAASVTSPGDSRPHLAKGNQSEAAPGHSDGGTSCIVCSLPVATATHHHPFSQWSKTTQIYCPKALEVRSAKSVSLSLFSPWLPPHLVSSPKPYSYVKLKTKHIHQEHHQP